MIATLWHLGWNPLTYNQWIDPHGHAWNVGMDALNKQLCPHLLVYALQDDANAIFWKGAAEHFNGAGLQGGVAHDYSMRLLRSYRKQKNT